MNTYIILLRGVNVGGKNILPMKELKAVLESNGFEGVQTYIQSGNIVLNSSDNPESKVGSLIQKTFGFTTKVLAITISEFELSICNNPYQNFEGKFVHFYFCKNTPKANSSIKLRNLAVEKERYELVGNVFYLQAPNGIGRSKIVASIEACLGVSATGRNLNTINKLSEIIKNLK